jgi:hypothetical protein
MPIIYNNISKGKACNRRKYIINYLNHPLNTIINIIGIKGTIDDAMLFESTFTDLHFGGIMGLFDESTLGKIISLIEQVNRNADVAK